MKRKIFLLTALLLLGATLGVLAINLQPRQEISKVLKYKEPMSLDQIIHAAFIFSGLNEKAALKYERTLKDRVESFLKNPATKRVIKKGVDSVTAEYTLAYMHKNLLSHYLDYQTSMEVLMDTGVYNCVSSAVLYMILLKSLGFSEVLGVKTHDHAFCRVIIKGHGHDVETTSAYGYDPAAQGAFFEDFSKKTGYTYIPVYNYGDRQETDEKGLLVLILRNKAVISMAEGEAEQALQHALDSYAVVNDEETKEALITSVIFLADYYIKKNDFENSLGLLENFTREYGTNDKLREEAVKIIKSWVVSLLKRKKFEQTQAVIDEQLKKGNLKPEEAKTLMILYYEKMAFFIREKEGSRAACLYINQKITETKDKDKLPAAQTKLWADYEAEVHAQVVDLNNREEYIKARDLLEMALQIMPDSKKLRQDLDFINNKIK